MSTLPSIFPWIFPVPMHTQHISLPTKYPFFLMPMSPTSVAHTLLGVGPSPGADRLPVVTLLKESDPISSSSHQPPIAPLLNYVTVFPCAGLVEMTTAAVSSNSHVMSTRQHPQHPSCSGAHTLSTPPFHNLPLAYRGQMDTEDPFIAEHLPMVAYSQHFGQLWICISHHPLQKRALSDHVKSCTNLMQEATGAWSKLSRFEHVLAQWTLGIRWEVPFLGLLWGHIIYLSFSIMVSDVYWACPATSNTEFHRASHLPSQGSG